MIPTDFISDAAFYLPEMDPYNPSFDLYDYGSTIFVDNMGTNLWIQAFFILLIIILIMFYWLKCLRTRLGAFLAWNALIRLFMESYLESTLLSTLNIYTIDWSTKFTAILVSNVFSIVWLTIFSIVPLILVYKFWKKKDSWHLPIFKVKFGALL